MPPPPQPTKPKIPLWIPLSLLIVVGLIAALLSNYSTDYLVFGTYCGACEANCNTFYLIDDLEVIVDTSTAYQQQMAFENRYDFAGSPLSPQMHFRTPALHQRIPAPLFLLGNSATPPTQNKPCGFYVQFEKWGIRKQLSWDPDHPPFLARSFTDELLHAEEIIRAETQRVSAYYLREH